MYSFYIKFSTYAKPEITEKTNEKVCQKNSFPHIVDKVVNNYFTILYIVNK